MTKWTVSDIGDRTGRTYVVTGANSGLGAATTRVLVAAGAEVIMACRDVAKAEVLGRELGERADVRRLDLADLASVREFAGGVEQVDVLVNNAGVMAVPNRRTVDGFEMHMGTNHLGHFALTGLLLPKVTERVVTVSSFMHRFATVDLDDLNWERRSYRRWSAYGQSKLANLLFAYELQRRLIAAGSTVLSVAAHPGYAATNLQSHTESVLGAIMAVTKRLIAQSADSGALPTLRAACATVEPGSYYGPGAGLRGHPVRTHSSPASREVETARELWQRSQELTGVEYPHP